VNLKQAARRLGVHYQTAYKLVRSGRLSAVCIGSRYEISDAAIEAYLAERQAMRRAPARARKPAPVPKSSDPFASADAALRTLTCSAPTVMELASEALVEALGDLAVARELSADREAFLPAVVRHADPVRRTTTAATIGAVSLPVAGSQVLDAVAAGSTVFRHIVAQDCVRRRVDPEITQYLDVAGVHSMIVAPARSDDEVVGMIGVTRDEPGQPYSRADVEVVQRAAAITGAAIARSRLTNAARARRRVLVDAVTQVLECGGEAPSVQTVLEDGPLGEFVCDALGRVITANEAAGRLFDVKVAEILGRRFVEIAGSEPRDQQLAQCERLVRGELTYADTHLRRAGRPDTAARLAIVRDVHAHPRAIVAVVHELPIACATE
jgi:excisionase family DNA binding protein